jgi:Carboxypeptidase regulatory-like domain
MAIAGKIFIVLGAGLLLLAGFIVLGGLTQSSGWIQFPASFYLAISAVFAVPGGALLLLGFRLMGEVRGERERIETLESNQGTLRGFVCDASGSPIPRATVDVFIEGLGGKRPAASTRTGSGGRFAVELPEGQYLLEVGVPELGESSMPVAVSKSGDSAELQIKLPVATS